MAVIVSNGTIIKQAKVVYFTKTRQVVKSWSSI